MAPLPLLKRTHLAGLAGSSVTVFCAQAFVYALVAGDFCSGTGTGETRFYRLCNDSSFLVANALDPVLLLCLILMLHVKSGRLATDRVSFAIGVIVYQLTGILAAYVIWASPLFLQSIR
jgi:hypothetical protein